MALLRIFVFFSFLSSVFLVILNGPLPICISHFSHYSDKNTQLKQLKEGRVDFLKWEGAVHRDGGPMVAGTCRSYRT